MDAKNPSTSDAVWIEINGSIEIGSIGAAASKAIGMPAGPIRLAEGIPGPKGYGLAHIAEDRAQSLREIGFQSPREAFVEVAANWEQAIQANEPNKVVLVRKHRGRFLRMVVQVFSGPNGPYWSATTIIIGRRVKTTEVIHTK